MLDLIQGILRLVAAICIVGCVIYIRWTHRDYSETRLFIEFWYVWLSCIVTCIVMLPDWNRKKKR